jgi:hypothetical protein
MYFLNEQRADYTLTPQSAKSRGYTWVYDLPNVPQEISNLDEYFKLVYKHGYMFGKAKYDNDPAKYPQTGLYRPLTKRKSISPF